MSRLLPFRSVSLCALPSGQFDGIVMLTVCLDLVELIEFPIFCYTNCVTDGRVERLIVPRLNGERSHKFVQERSTSAQ